MTHLKAGDKAPDFTSTDQNGKTVSLKDFKGKKVVLYFYPKDNTPGCTAEACNLRDNHEILQSKGYQVVGVSADNQKSHQSFISKFDLPFILLSDTDKSILKAYGVWGPKKFMGKTFDGIHRTTFLISEDGSIEKVIADVKTKDHTDQILNG
ncbi:MAG: thioredoxin-dependent thiol peroxidase [Bacteroidetes bacterium]|nr:thioredoxin-dependent thiol peroxidase [Bacteroidota bacterium]